MPANVSNEKKYAALYRSFLAGRHIPDGILKSVYGSDLARVGTFSPEELAVFVRRWGHQGAGATPCWVSFRKA